MHNKIFSRLIFSVAFIFILCSMCFAEGLFDGLHRAKLEESILNLAKKIINDNKPSFEVKSNNLPLYNAVWVINNNTIVVAIAEDDKKYIPLIFETKNSKFNFAGGLRVGANLKKANDYTGLDGTNIVNASSEIHFKIDAKNKITAIGLMNINEAVNKPDFLIEEAVNFFNVKDKELGFPKN